jgi:type IV pilus assembly protein PilC
MLYRYQAYNVNKQIAEGSIESLSEKNAEEALYQAGYKYVLNLKAVPARKSFSQLVPTLFGIKNQDIIDFSRQLASFLETGSSLHGSLQLIQDQASKAALKEVIAGIIRNLEAGQSFSQAVKNYPATFPYSYWQIIQSSEKAGELEKGLKQIAQYMERKAVIAEKIKRALTYPVFIIMMAIGVTALLVTTVLPSMLKLFAGFKADLPPLTVFVINLMNFITDYKFHILVALVVIIGSLLVYSRTPGGRFNMHKLILKLPFIGSVIIWHNLGNFCRTVSMLLSAGLPLPDILDVAIQSSRSNLSISESLITLKQKVMQGEGLARPMATDKLFPKMMLRMVTVGESTGTLDSSFAVLADYYEEHSQKRIQSMISAIEPTLTVIIGIGIAFVMLSMVLPIYTVIGRVR